MKCKYFKQCDMKEVQDDETSDCIFDDLPGHCEIDYDVNMGKEKEVEA